MQQYKSTIDLKRFGCSFLSLASKSGDETSASAISPTSQKSSLSEQEAVDEIVTEVAR